MTLDLNNYNQDFDYFETRFKKIEEATYAKILIVENQIEAGKNACLP